MAKTTAEKIAVMQAFEEGKKIEIDIQDGRGFHCLGWIPNWNWEENDYRIKPQPAPIPMTIPWEAIDEKWQWAAMDSDGSVYLYTGQPLVAKAFWIDGDIGYHIGANCLKINKGTVSWDNSLQQRPQA